jgi:AbrB family looped-hinge helix DNA binding protein
MPMQTAKVLARGQVTLPAQARERADIRPGDTVVVQVVGRGDIRLIALPRLKPRELRELYPITGPVDVDGDREIWQGKAAADVIGE